MSKDPAFLFYSADFLVGTMELSWEDKGKYIYILCLMHQKGPLSHRKIEDLIGNFSEELKEKFKKNDKNLLYNERLEEERKKRAQYSEKQRLNVKKRWDKHKKKKSNTKVIPSYNGGNTNVIPLENENENINRDINRNINFFEKFEKLSLDEVWNLWKDYKKKEFGFKYKSEQSEQSALTKLKNLAGEDGNLAKDIIQQSMANGWKGFFPLPDKKQNKNQERVESREERMRKNLQWEN